MAEVSVLEQQQRIVGPDGTTIYIGDGEVMNPFTATSTEASATMAVSEAARLDSTNTIIPRFESVAAGSSPSADIPQSGVKKVLRISAATNLILCGVARTAIPAGGKGGFAGISSIVTVKYLASPTATALGGSVIGSATAGSVDSLAVATVSARGLSLGILVKNSGTGAGQTGSTTQAGVLIAPW